MERCEGREMASGVTCAGFLRNAVGILMVIHNLKVMPMKSIF